MAEKFKPVKDEIYKQNERLLAVICISIIVFIVSSVLWMIFDSDVLLGISFICLSVIMGDLAIILKRRKKGIYLITDEEYAMMDKENEKSRKPKRLKDR